MYLLTLTVKDVPIRHFPICCCRDKPTLQAICDQWNSYFRAVDVDGVARYSVEMVPEVIPEEVPWDAAAG